MRHVLNYIFIYQDLNGFNEAHREACVTAVQSQAAGPNVPYLSLSLAYSNTGFCCRPVEGVGAHRRLGIMSSGLPDQNGAETKRSVVNLDQVNPINK